MTEQQAMSDDARRAAWRPRANPWVIASAVTLGTFMEVLDTTIVNVSLPHIAGSLSAGLDESTWTLTSYLVANSIVLPISGYLGRVFGRKNFYMLCMAAFTLSSFLCGTATSLSQIVAFRMLQGFFGGGLQPTQQAIVLDAFPPSQRASAFSLVAVTTILAPIIGPTLGGWITDAYSWRWIFWINIPIGIFATIAVWNVVEDPPWLSERDRSRPDFVGLSLIAIGFGCMQIMLDRGEYDDWFDSDFIRTLAIVSSVALGVAIFWLWNNPRPVVNLRVLKDRNFALGCAVISAMTMVLFSTSVLLPQLAQTQLGYTSLLAGLVISPGGFVVAGLIPVVNQLIKIVQTRFLVVAGLSILGVALIAAHGITPQVTFFNLAFVRISQTCGIALLFVPTSMLAYSTLPRTLSSDATALYSMFRNLFGSIGIALVTASTTMRGQVDMAQYQRNLSPLNPMYAETLADYESKIRGLGVAPSMVAATARYHLNDVLAQQAAFTGYIETFLYCGVMALALAPIGFLFPPIKGGARGPAAH